MSNLSAYIAYFRRLAVAHKDIKHDPASETGDAPIESKKFAKWNAEELVRGDLKSKMSFAPAALLLEFYDTDLQANNAYDIKQKPKGAFTVLCKAFEATSIEEERAYTLGETIAYELLQQIWKDHHGEGATLCNTPFHRFWFDKANVTLIGPLYESCYGARCEFDFEFQQSASIITPPQEGVFNF